MLRKKDNRENEWNRRAEEIQNRFSWGVLALFAGSAFALFFFKILGLDFWLHVKLGEVIVQTHTLPLTDPFSYILAGKTLQTHYEYLSQIVFYLLFHYGGATGFILFRIAVAIAIGGLLFSIDRKSAWPHILLVIWGLEISRPGFVDRPQLFTFLFFVAFLVLVFRFLSQPAKEGASAWERTRLLWGMVGIELLWANFHGGGHVFGFLLYGALFGQRLFERFVRKISHKDLPLLLWFGLGIAAVSFMTPNTYHTYRFLFQLLGETSNTLIREWRVKPFPEYLRDCGVFWALAWGTLLLRRKDAFFCGTILLVLGAFSFRMQRLEVLFILGAIGVTLYQLRFYSPFQWGLTRLFRKPWRAGGLALSLVAVQFAWIYGHGMKELRRLNYYGTGISAHAEDACNFLDREKIQGRLFNNYDIGAYLIFRGYSVFIDGRNADYGTAFTENAMKAGYDPALWAQLEQTYGFTISIVDFIGIGNPNLPYVQHLDQNPQWALVYLDDWVAVYLKRGPSQEALIERLGYKVISPSALEFGLGALQKRGDPILLQTAKKELERLILDAPRAMKGRIVLAQLCLRDGEVDRALQLGHELLALHPYSYNAYEIFGMGYAAKGEWGSAGHALEKAIALAPPNAPPINYSYLAEIFSKAGNKSKWNKYLNKALSAPLR